MDLVGHTLVVAMASRLFQIWDVRNMQSPVSQRESSLKYMTRAVACMSDQKGQERIIWAPIERPNGARRLCHGICRRADRGGIRRPRTRNPGQEIRVQVPSTDNR